MTSISTSSAEQAFLLDERLEYDTPEYRSVCAHGIAMKKVDSLAEFYLCFSLSKALNKNITL